MPIRFTVDNAAEAVANRMLSYQEPSISPGSARWRQLVPITKYNILVTTFNMSTVLLVIAVAATLLSAHTAAMTLGLIGISLRHIVQKELHSKLLQDNHIGVGLEALQAVINSVWRRDGGEGAHILGAAGHKDWCENEVTIFDYNLWKNKISISYTR